MSSRLYLDHSSGTPLASAARDAMAAWLDRTGNPSNHLHQEGREASHALDAARMQVAALIGASPDDIYFTASGTESNVWALRGLAAARRRCGRHIIVSSIEHISILRTLQRMQRDGYEVTYVPVTTDGCIEADVVMQHIRPDTALVSLMWANHEVGVLQPVGQLAALLYERGVPFHTDAVAAVGTEVVKIGALPVTALSCAANLFGGPAGIAALYVRSGTRMHPLFDGGIQEHGHRAGTENLLGIIGMGAAAADAEACLIARHGPRQARRDQLERQLTALIPDVRIFGQGASRLPGHSCFGIPGVDGEALVCGLDREGIALVQSSACMSQTLRASHVLRAMGVAESEAQQACLAVVDHVLTEAQVGQVAQSVARVANQLRAIQPLVSSGQNRSK